MANRFERLFQLPQNQYIEGSPVILAAGVLSKDNETGSIIAQLKFQSVSEKRIKAVKVSLAAYDVSKADVQGVNDYQYLELDVANGQEFGANRAIVMPNPVSRSFAVSAITVVFIDGTMWENTVPFATLPTVKPLSFGNAEMEKQYRIATNNSAQYVPSEDKGLWQCACGVWNKSSSCTHCRISQNKVFSAFNISLLTEQMNARLAAEAEQRRINAEKEAEKKAQQEVSKKAAVKKFKLITAIVVPVVVGILLFTQWILPNFIQPAVAYNNAEEMLSAGQYDEAKKAFEALGEYSDSAEMVIEVSYQKACHLEELGDYDAALSAFNAIGEYKESKNHIENIVEITNARAYDEAVQKFNAGEYDAAIEMFELLGNYKDCTSFAEEAKYLYANDMLKNSQYEDAKVLFEEVAEYSDSKDKIIECNYLIAQNLLAKNKYLDALPLFEALNNYKDSQMYLSECKYLKAKGLIASGDYSDAVSLLSEISQYKDASEYIKLIENIQSLVFVGESTSYSWEYMWVVSEINTENCTSRLVVYEGRADGRNDTIDVTYRSGDSMLKAWKTENGLIYMTEAGQDYSQSKAIFRTWKVSGSWNSIYAKTYTNNGKLLGDPGEYDVNWTRLDDATAQIIKESFIKYFEIDEYNDWDSEDWIAAKATLNK